MDLKELESGVDPNTHWYYQTKKIPMLRYVKKLIRKQPEGITVIDFGAGSGFFGLELLSQFPEFIIEVILVDLNYSDEELVVQENPKVRKVREMPDKVDNSVVLMMDVLEHIEKDGEVLEIIRTRAGRNAHFFITVPAFMDLWSDHDVYLGHYRRYRLKGLQKVLSESGCFVDRTYYIYGLIFPLVWIFRKLVNKPSGSGKPESDMKKANPAINWILKMVNSLEMNFRKINRLFGVTCVAEGRLE